MSELMSTKDAAEILGVSDQRVRQLCLSGDLPATKINRDWVISRSDLVEFIERRKAKQAAN